MQYKKIFATSITYNKGTQPQWIDDTQINYMSQYDFISYQLDKDKYTLIEKVKGYHHEVIYVQYASTVDHKNDQIIYLYREKIKNKKYSEQHQQLYSYHIMMVSSVKSKSKFNHIKIVIPQQDIKIVHSFCYLQKNQSIIFPILYSNGIIGIGYKSLTCNLLLYFNFPQQVINQQHKNQIINLSKISQPTAQPLYTFLSEQSQFCQSYIKTTKQQNEFIFIIKNKIHLFHIQLQSKSIQLINSYQITQFKIPQPKSNKQQNQLYKFIPCYDIILLNLSKIYLLIKFGKKLYLYYVEQSKICFTQQCSLIKSENYEQSSIQISGSSRGNMILVLMNEKTQIHQYKINEAMNKIQYINCIDLLSEHGGIINKIVVSERGKNVALFTLNENNGQARRGKGSIKMNNVTKFSIFNIEQYSQLGNPQVALCFKQLKCQSQITRVNRLVVPKIYQNLYALTGSLVHDLLSKKCHKLTGVQYFDVHPTGFYMAVSYQFNISIYSLQYNSMTLLYSTSMENIKKVMYSPDGSMLVMVSGKKIRILNAYSFQLQQEISDKNSTIMDIYFLPKKSSLLTLYDNGIGLQRSLLDIQKSKSYWIISDGYTQFYALRIDEANNNFYIILKNGELLIKTTKDELITDVRYKYEDQQKISQIFIQAKNNLIFVGTRSGSIRVHNRERFSIYQFQEINIMYAQITTITCSCRQNYVYVGNVIGDITWLQYRMDKLLQNNPRSTKGIQKKNPYSNINFYLLSQIKLFNNEQINKLQTKLLTVTQNITTCQNEITKQNILLSDIKQQQYATSDDHKNIYKQFDNKYKKIKNDMVTCKSQCKKNKKNIILEYQNLIIYNVNIYNHLQQSIEELKVQCQREKKQVIQQYNHQIQQLELLLNQQMERQSKFVDEKHLHEQFTHLDNFDDFQKISKIEAHRELHNKLSEQLQLQQSRCRQLRKNINSLQNIKTNMISKKTNQQSLQNRVHEQLKLYHEIKDKQRVKTLTLRQQIKQTQYQLQRMENTHNMSSFNGRFSDMTSSNECSYKILIQQNIQKQLQQFEEYLKYLDNSCEMKEEVLVEQAMRLKKSEDLIEEMKKKIEVLKQELKKKKIQLKYVENRNKNIYKLTQPIKIPYNSNKHTLTKRSFNSIQRIMSIQKQNERKIYEEKIRIKIDVKKYKKMNSNNTELLNQYQQLKYQNKQLLNMEYKLIKQLENIKEISKETHPFSFNNIIKSSPFLKYIQNRAAITKRSCIMENTADTTPSNRASFGLSRRSQTMRSVNFSKNF